MTHQKQPIRNYHQGDALDLNVTVRNPDGSAKDLSGHGDIVWLLKHDQSHDDGNAILEKTESGGGITVNTPSDGTLTVSIETDDTADVSGTKYHLLRVTDSNGDRVTVFTGDFEVLQ